MNEILWEHKDLPLLKKEELVFELNLEGKILEDKVREACFRQRDQQMVMRLTLI